MEKLTKENINSKIKTEKILVDFYATWCGPCKALSKVLEEVEKELNVTIFKADIEECEEVSKNLLINSIPTLILFENGVESKRLVGLIDKKTIINLLNEKKFIKR